MKVKELMEILSKLDQERNIYTLALVDDDYYVSKILYCQTVKHHNDENDIEDNLDLNDNDYLL